MYLGNRIDFFCQALGRSLRMGAFAGLSIYALATLFDISWLIQRDPSCHPSRDKDVESMSYGELQREYERIVNEQIEKQRRIDCNL
jgi:hypothetical protein